MKVKKILSSTAMKLSENFFASVSFFFQALSFITFIEKLSFENSGCPRKLCTSLMEIFGVVSSVSMARLRVALISRYGTSPHDCLPYKV